MNLRHAPCAEAQWLRWSIIPCGSDAEASAPIGIRSEPNCASHLTPATRIDTMAFNSLMMQLVAELRATLPDSPSVIEFGNQTFKPRAGDFERVRTQLAARRTPFDERLFGELATRTGDARDASTADYYRALGFTTHRAIDVNARYGSLVMDLNRDLVDHYGFRETFDLVTNNGTGSTSSIKPPCSRMRTPYASPVA